MKELVQSKDNNNNKTILQINTEVYSNLVNVITRYKAMIVCKQKRINKLIEEKT